MDASAGTAPSAPASPPGSTPLVLAFAVAAVGGAVAAVSFRAFDLDRFFVPKELALHVAALMIVVPLTRRRAPAPWTRADLALAAWLAVSAASAVLATSGWLAARALALSLSAAMIFWAGPSLYDAGRARGVAALLAVAATLAAGSSLAQAYGVSVDLFSANRAPGGLLGNRNFVAHVAAMGLPLLVWLTATARSAGGGVVGALALLVNAAALVLSRTRAAWLALAIWLPLVAFAVWRHGLPRDPGRPAVAPRGARAIVAGIAGGIVIAVAIPNTLDWRSDSPYLDSVRGVVNYREGSGAGRLRQYANSLKLTRAHPLLGVGPGNWASEYPAVASRNDPSISDATGMASNPWPSSDWVAAMAERGVPAALALAAFVLLLLRQAWRTWRAPERASHERLAALAGGSVVLIGAVEGMFDAVSLLALPSVMLFAAAGALIPRGTAVATRAAATRAPATRAVLTAAAAVCWLAIVAMTAARLDAMRRYAQGTAASVRMAAALDPGSYRIQMRAADIAAARGDCKAATRYATAARGLFPHAAAPQAILARCR
ncbi:MAG TPA: O-antigen ligase family protein [Gemmatimonadaceae bacterium]|nr:O-antigen ligase family protein [Gemmatimonadaceae bacterium]